MIGRRAALAILGSAGAAVAARRAAAVTLSDLIDNFDIGMRFAEAGIPTHSYSIPSGSMIPTLVPGDVVLADLRGAEKMPRRGDLIVFSLPKDTSILFVKRVVGLPGDRVQLTGGRLTINGQVAKRREVDPYEMDFFGRKEVMHRYVETLPAWDGSTPVAHGILEQTDTDPLDETPEYLVPAGHCFTLGDNRDNSDDSRSPVVVGYVPVGNIVGRVVYRVRPHSNWLVPPETVPGLG